MYCKMDKDLSVLISQCNNKSQLSIPNIFTLFGDLASEHAPHLGLGSDVLSEKALFWVAVRTKIKITELPKLTDAFHVSTWPEAPGKVRCIRYYKLSSNSITLVEGKTEWAIVDIESGKPRKLSEIYPDGLIHSPDTVCAEPFSKISEIFDDCELLGKYKVTSADIDIGQHMNNARYVHALFSLFSCKEIESMNISDMEINFRTSCYEGDELTFLKRHSDSYTEIGIIRPDGKVAATIRMS